MDFMTPEADNGWQWPFDDLLIDAPNNLMYEHYFMRPAGIVVINCDGGGDRSQTGSATFEQWREPDHSGEPH